MLKKWIGFCAILAIIGIGLYAYADYQTAQRVKAELDQFTIEFAKTGQGELSYHDVDVGLFAKNVQVHNVLFLPADPTEPTLSIDKVTVSKLNIMNDQNRLPEELHLEMENAVITISNANDMFSTTEPMVTSILTQVFSIEGNTAKFVYDAEMGYELNEKTHVLNLYSNYSAPEMMTSEFSVDVANIPNFSEMAIPVNEDDDQILQQMMQHFSKATLKQLQFNFNDAGMMKKFYTAAVMNPDIVESMRAAGKEPTIENFKQMMIAQLEQNAQSEQMRNNPMAQQILTYSREFLTTDSPELDLTINSVKPEGLDFTDLLVLLMSNGHPDMVSQLLEINVQVQ